MTGAPPPPSIGAGVLATALGGALGAVLRWALTQAFPTSAGRFPWTVLLINVVGSGLLASLPLLGEVRRRPWLPLFLGTGVLGGFTTMSAASTDTFTLLDHGHVGLGIAYCLGTLAAALGAVLVVGRLSTADERGRFDAAGGEE